MRIGQSPTTREKLEARSRNRYTIRGFPPMAKLILANNLPQWYIFYHRILCYRCKKVSIRKKTYMRFQGSWPGEMESIDFRGKLGGTLLL